MTIIESARALLIDPRDRVLLMKLAFNTGRTCWLTPGGSLNPGETFEAALRREILEETGLALDEPGHWVWTSPKRIMRDGRPLDTLARVYIQRVPHFAAAPTALTRAEREMFRELRWWSIEEIARSRETFIPRALALLLAALLDGPWPAAPIQIVP
ncbi:MAG: NUDIX domain-containing protein [Betaproteobacteria bacterium]|nr:NUDIX domain-containing protein [Betaproteobacteria bacterium]